MNILGKLGITPGPWKGVIVEFKGDNYIGVANEKQYIPGYGETIAICGNAGGKKEKKTISDVQLIAAAPEMLEKWIEYVLAAECILEEDTAYEGNKEIIEIIEKATDRTWEEIKELIDGTEN